MIVVRENYDNKGLIISNLVEYNEEAFKKAKKVFEEYKNKKVLINCDFDDNIWSIFNGLNINKFNFTLNQVMYENELKKRSAKMLSYKEFVNSLKSYVLLILGTRAASEISNYISKLIKFINDTHYMNEDFIEKRLEFLSVTENGARVTTLKFIIDFLSFIELDELEAYRELLEDDRENISNLNSSLQRTNDLNRRELADFQSLFLFDKILDEFWNEDITDTERLIYYPIFLWWKITNVLPLRVSEFLVTPYNCLSPDSEGNYQISIRRSILKGRKNISTLKISYSIEKDYEIKTFAISNKIAEEILNYNRLLKEKFNITERKLLIVKGKSTVAKNSYNVNAIDYDNPYNIFRIHNLRELIQKFYIEVIQNKKRVSILENDNKVNKPLKINTIRYIKPGDTRHFAIINMILNDFNPILIKEFAGHSNINTTYHYSSNIGNLVKCISYNKYRELCEYTEDELISPQININGDKVLIRMNQENLVGIELDNGKCLSKHFYMGNLSDCKVVAGECTICNFFERTKKDSSEERKKRLKVYEDNINREGRFLGQLINDYKDDIRQYKAISESITKIQSESARYLREVEINGGYYGE